MNTKKSVRITFAEGFQIGLVITVGGLMALTGVLLCILLFTWPLGMMLIVAAGKMMQKTFDRIFKRVDRDLAIHDNEVSLHATITMEEDDLPWTS
jgi:uncharacterized membrane protein